MFRPASLFLGLRYTRAKRKNHFISFISLISMLGIALGITVLITVLSVMNGFDREIHNRIFSIVAPMTISSDTGYIADWQGLQKIVSKYSYVTGTAPYVQGQVLLNAGSIQPALLMGVLPNQEKNVSHIEDKFIEGSMAALKPGEFDIAIGESLASSLNVHIGDKITVMTPQGTVTPVGFNPRVKRFTVVGIFKAGGGFGFDKSLAYVNLGDAQKLMGLGDNISGLHAQVNDVYAAPYLAQQMMRQLSSNAYVTTWADQFGEFFHAVALEKTMMFFILLLIIAVAAFNLVSTLIMVVNEKQADIAILRTLGATPAEIMTVFFVQGGVIGLMGTALGLIGGLLLAWNVTSIVNWIQDVFNVQFMSSNIYYVNYLPSQIESADVLKICSAALVLSLIATLYPAWRASKTDPVESLRYE